MEQDFAHTFQDLSVSCNTNQYHSRMDHASHSLLELYRDPRSISLTSGKKHLVRKLLRPATEIKISVDIAKQKCVQGRDWDAAPCQIKSKLLRKIYTEMGDKRRHSIRGHVTCPVYLKKNGQDSTHLLHNPSETPIGCCCAHLPAIKADWQTHWRMSMRLQGEAVP